MMSLAQIAQNKKQQAPHRVHQRGVVRGTPERLAELANDAGMEPAAADAFSPVSPTPAATWTPPTASCVCGVRWPRPKPTATRPNPDPGRDGQA